MVITIDGPAGAGKSSAAMALARRLGFDYLDTGATYRAATWKALKAGVDMNDAAQVAEQTRRARIEFVEQNGGKRLFCDGHDVTEAIRTPRVTENIYHVADEPQARQALIRLQRQMAAGRDIVTEGRDQGTEVFPDAEVKFFLDASVEERAARRLRDLQRAGVEATRQQVEEQIRIRDIQDNSRPAGALRKTQDMILIDNTGLSADQVVQHMYEAIAERFPDRINRKRK